MNSRMLHTIFVVALVCLGCVATNGAEREGDAKGKDVVELHYGKGVTLNQEAVELLRSKAIELLETSNFNSRAPRWEWDLSKIQADYRQAVAGKYLLVTFKEPRTIRSVGGELSVREIVIGLNRSDFASPVLTIDDENRVVGHAKYSGALCVKLMEAVKKLAGE